VYLLYKDAVDSAIVEKCASCHQEGYASNKTYLKQNPPVLDWRPANTG